MLQKRAYSKLTREAVDLLGRRIKLARKKRRWPESELAERAGIARETLRKIERGDPSSSIGLVFEVAVLVGINLFEVTSARDMVNQRKHIEEQLKLLPKHTHAANRIVDDEF
ncbi:MAG: helix-turn-helix transcriptional regulator [Desulfovibrionales bacterium]